MVTALYEHEQKILDLDPFEVAVASQQLETMATSVLYICSRHNKSPINRLPSMIIFIFGKVTVWSSRKLWITIIFF